MLTRLATPKPSQSPTWRSAAWAIASPRPAASTTAATASPPGAVAAGRADQRVLADLGLPAAARAARAGPALRVDHHVADLAAVPAVAGHRPAAGDDAAADAGVAVQVDDVVAADRDPAGVLGQRGQVGAVADRRRDVAAAASRPAPRPAPRRAARRPSRRDRPRRTRPSSWRTIALTAAPRCRRRPRRAARCFSMSRTNSASGATTLSAGRSPRGPGDLAPVEHHAAETDPGRGDPVDLDAERVHVEPFRLRAAPPARAGRPGRGRAAPPRGPGRPRPGRR